MDTVNKERGLISSTEVDLNINEFQPKAEEAPKTRSEFNSLVDRLQLAFTIPQLVQYIEAFEGKRTLQLSNEPNPAHPLLVRSQLPPIRNDVFFLKEGPWVPEITDPTGYLAEKISLRGYALASHTTKQRLAVRVLRECWMLQLPDVLQSLGHVDLLLRSNDLDLLSSGFLCL